MGMRGRLVAPTAIACLLCLVITWAVQARTYSWAYDGRLWRIQAELSTEQLRDFASLPRGWDYSAYVGHHGNVDAVRDVVDALGAAADDAGYGERQTAGLVVAFVQALPYVVDNQDGVAVEYPRYPLETLFDGGDCEDKAILAAALMKGLGMSVGLLHFTATLPAHMAVGIALSERVSGTYFPHDGKRYYYGETTEPGWQIGEVPPQVRGNLAYIEPV
ncbi:MAG: hypothetical protein JSW65_04100 [Candidatus Bipolaricaulota bacterium]|nr:MAG: hypothetical protein JSW65_04100 [Candidatus Bipolaricaulota bacterium]